MNPQLLARATDPGTSHEAAQACLQFSCEHRRKILEALQQGPAGKCELARRTGLDGVAIARRLPELQREGLAKPTGRRVLSLAARPEREWEALRHA